jgi:hypothetical protein
MPTPESLSVTALHSREKPWSMNPTISACSSMSGSSLPNLECFPRSCLQKLICVPEESMKSLCFGIKPLSRRGFRRSVLSLARGPEKDQGGSRVWEFGALVALGNWGGTRREGLRGSPAHGRSGRLLQPGVQGLTRLESGRRPRCRYAAPSGVWLGGSGAESRADGVVRPCSGNSGSRSGGRRRHDAGPRHALRWTVPDRASLLPRQAASIVRTF